MSSLAFHNCHLFVFHNCHLCVTRDKSEETMRFKIRQWVRGRAKPGVPVPVRGCSCVPPGHCTARIPVSLTHSLLLLFPGLAECHPSQIASSFPSRQGKRPARLCSPHAQPLSRLSQFSPKNCGGGSWRCPALRGERCPSDTAVTASGICLGGQGLLPEVRDVLCHRVTTQNPPGFTRDGLLVSADVGNAGAS